MPIILKNNASSPLTASITASDTGLVVANGNQFPALSAGEYFYATLVSTAGTTEIVKVTARVSNSLSVVRAQDGTSAASFAAGTLVEMRVNAASVIDLVDEHDQASEISIADAGGYYTSDNVEGALQEAAVYNQGGTGSVTRTVQSRLRDFVSVKDFGAVGDGVTDDTVAIQAAIDTGLNLHFPSGNYIAKNLSFSSSNASYIFASGSKLVFNGTTTDHLYTVSGDNVTFVDPVFDGNGVQPSLSLGYITTGTDRFVLRGGRTQNIVGTVSGSNLVNQCYGLGISPDTVTNFLIDGHEFKNISKDNTGTFFPQTEGIGFCGGIVLILPTGTDPVAPYSGKSSGQITNCVFDNIQTIRAAGLSSNNQIKYDDGDGIRFYGNETYTPDCDIVISDCTFRDCSKRAIKIAIRGVKIYDIDIISTGAVPYQMATLVKLHNDNMLRGVTAKMGSAAREVRFGIQTTLSNAANEYAEAHYVKVDYASVLAEVIGQGSASLDNIVFKNFSCPNVSLRCVNESAGGATTCNTRIENFNVKGRGTVAAFLVGSTNGFVIREIRAENMTLKVPAGSFYIDEVDVVISDASFTGPVGVAPLEISGGDNWTIGRMSLDVTALGAGVFLNSTTYVALIYAGSNAKIREFYLKTADAAAITSSHIRFYGSDMTIGRVIYEGPSSVDIGVLVASDRVSVDSIIRKGSASTTRTAVFVGGAGTDKISVGEVHDMRPSNQPSFRLMTGSGPAVIHNITSLTSGGAAAQDDTGGNLTVGSATIL